MPGRQLDSEGNFEVAAWSAWSCRFLKQHENLPDLFNQMRKWESCIHPGRQLVFQASADSLKKTVRRVVDPFQERPVVGLPFHFGVPCATHRGLPVQG